MYARVVADMSLQDPTSPERTNRGTYTMDTFRQDGRDRRRFVGT